MEYTPHPLHMHRVFSWPWGLTVYEKDRHHQETGKDVVSKCTTVVVFKVIFINSWC